MQIKIINKPNRKITQSVLYFQFRFMGWNSKEMEYQDDRFGSLPFAYVICYKDNEMVGVVNLLKRKIIFKGEKILLGGFGGVCIHIKYRRQGIALRLLKEGMKILKINKCDIAFLNTDIKKLGTLYGKVGFVPLGRKYKATGLSNKVYEDAGGMIAPICSKEIFNKVLKDTNIFDLQGQDW